MPSLAYGSGVDSIQNMVILANRSHVSCVVSLQVRLVTLYWLSRCPHQSVSSTACRGRFVCMTLHCPLKMNAYVFIAN